MKPERFDESWFQGCCFSPEYLYNLTLHETLYNHPYSSINTMLRQINRQFSFNLDHFYFFLTGLKKEIYSMLFSSETYMDIFFLFKEKVGIIMNAQNWTGDVFIVWKSDEKQIALLLSPKDSPRCSALTLAEIIHQLFEDICQQYLKYSDTIYHNTTALCGPFCGYPAISTGYHQARLLNDLSFLHTDNAILTEEIILKRKNHADYSTVLDRCMELRSFIDVGDNTQAQKLLKHLFLNILRHSYNLSLCDDALAFLKSTLQIRCTVYNVIPSDSFDTLCSRIHYHRIEDCLDTLQAVISTLCNAIKIQGPNTKPILSARYYISLHYREYLILNDIARYVGTNPNYLSGKFKDETGLSIRNYISKLRLNTAQHLLICSENTITQIAQEVGFEDVRYFTRVFKRYCGCTPTEFRQKSK